MPPCSSTITGSTSARPKKPMTARSSFSIAVPKPYHGCRDCLDIEAARQAGARLPDCRPSRVCRKANIPNGPQHILRVGGTGSRAVVSPGLPNMMNPPPDIKTQPKKAPHSAGLALIALAPERKHANKVILCEGVVIEQTPSRQVGDAVLQWAGHLSFPVAEQATIPDALGPARGRAGRPVPERRGSGRGLAISPAHLHECVLSPTAGVEQSIEFVIPLFWTVARRRPCGA